MKETSAFRALRQRAVAMYESGVQAAWTNPRSRIPDITGYSAWDRCSYWLGVRAARVRPGEARAAPAAERGPLTRQR